MKKMAKKDLKLLFYLNENARYSNTQLAKKSGISATNVQYRIDKMQQEGIINEFYLLLNSFAFKKRYDRLIIKFKPSWNKEQVEHYCTHTKNIGWYIFFDGSWNFGCQIWSDSPEETKSIIEKFLSKFSEYVLEYTVSQLLSIEHFEDQFLFSDAKIKRSKMQRVAEVKLDDIDKQIITILFRNARMKLLDVANKLQLDYKVVSYRLKRLEKTKVILGYKVNINRFTLGYDYYKICLKFSSYLKEDITSIKEFLRSEPRILYITEGLGWVDLEFEIFCENQEQYRYFQEAFRRKFSHTIREYETLIPLQFTWNHFMPLSSKNLPTKQ